MPDRRQCPDLILDVAQDRILAALEEHGLIPAAGWKAASAASAARAPAEPPARLLRSFGFLRIRAPVGWAERRIGSAP